MTCLVCDIGGTHIRFGLSFDHQTVAQITKLKVAAYPSFDLALRDYLRAQNDIVCDRLALATAARNHDGIYHFTNDNHWVIDPDKIRRDFSFQDFLILNDFDANARGIAQTNLEDLMILQKAHAVTEPHVRRMVIGVGTGLGLAYINPDHSIQPSFGGHMLPVLLTPEDHALFDFIHSKTKEKRAMIYEDVLSGRGLYHIYQFLSAQNHLDCELKDTQEMLRHPHNGLVQASFKIFARFLGLFAHQAAVFGHGFGGVYLTGGILDRMIPYDYFDVASFQSGFVQDNVPVVKKSFENTWVYWVRDEFISLKGLVGLCATPI